MTTQKKNNKLKNNKTQKRRDVEFSPNLSPREMFKLGSFGGTYWRPIKSKFFKNSKLDDFLIINFKPIQDDLVTAIKGEGAIHENVKIRNRSVSKAKILYVINDSKIKLNIENMLDGKERVIGSKSTELVYMAEGNVDLIIYPDISIWESAAGILICRESGVFVTDFKGGDDIYNSKTLIASKEWLHKKILPEIC